MLKKIVLIFTIILLATACCKKEEEVKAPIDQLPPLTHTGANKAGCLVDGEAFLPKGLPILCQYYQQQYFGLAIGKKINNKIHSVGLEVTGNLQVGQTYRLTIEDYITGHYGNWGIYTEDRYPPPNANYYATNDVCYGELTITDHNFSEATISGTFWFNGINNEGKVVRVTDGRFDCEY